MRRSFLSRKFNFILLFIKILIKLNRNIEWGDAYIQFSIPFYLITLLDKNITLNVYIKAVGLLGQGVFIAIRGDDAATPTGNAEAFVTTQGHQQINGSFDWKNFIVTMDKVPANIKSLTFYLIYSSNTSGTVYFDDVSLTKE
jgi:hypothetical protein